MGDRTDYACIGCGFEVVKGEKPPKKCPGCGHSISFAQSFRSEMGEKDIPFRKREISSHSFINIAGMPFHHEPGVKS